MGLLALLANPAQAKLVTEIVKVSVSVANMYGKITERHVVVTLLHDDACTDGHGVFSRDPVAWRTQVLQFMKANGFPDLKETEEIK